jgi:hypothetical protein
VVGFVVEVSTSVVDSPEVEVGSVVLPSSPQAASRTATEARRRGKFERCIGGR